MLAFYGSKQPLVRVSVKMDLCGWWLGAELNRRHKDFQFFC